MSDLLLDLPYPPSVNRYWRSRVIRKRGKMIPSVYVTEEGMAYRQNVGQECLVQNAKMRISGPVRLEADFYPPDNRLRDIDNPLKALLDALTHGAVYGDDSQIRELEVRMHTKKPPGRAVIRIWRISDMHCAHAQMDLAG